jgi:multiple sugar transport system ATP-binding protein
VSRSSTCARSRPYFTVTPSQVVGDDTVDLAAGSDGVTASGSTHFVARVTSRTAGREGSPIELAVDTSQLHFFDRDTGVAI